MTTIFDKIIKGEIPSTKVYENEWVLIIEDIHPLAPIHWLVIPKQQIRTFQEMKPTEFSLFEKMIEAIQQVTNERQIGDYRLVINNGEKAGQTIFHLHIHILAGRQSSNHVF